MIVIRLVGLFACLVVLMGPFYDNAEAESGRPDAGVIKFDAYRNGNHFGFSMLRIEGPEGGETVDVVTALRVGLGPFTAFKYLLRTRSKWRNGKIARLESVVNDDGEIFKLTARQQGRGVAVDGSEGRYAAPIDIVPTTYWKRGLVHQSQLLNTQHGGIFNVTVERGGEGLVVSEGRELMATRYLVRGDLDIDIWYDTRDEWVKLTFKVGDSNVEYKRVTPRPVDMKAFVNFETVPEVSGSDVHAMIDPG